MISDTELCSCEERYTPQQFDLALCRAVLDAASMDDIDRAQPAATDEEVGAAYEQSERPSRWEEL